MKTPETVELIGSRKKKRGPSVSEKTQVRTDKGHGGSTNPQRSTKKIRVLVQVL